VSRGRARSRSPQTGNHAALKYGGICQILSVLRYPLADSIVKLINAIIRRAFRERLLLGDFGPLPWAFHAKVVAEGVMVALVGMLIGLWALARSQHRPAP